eukprot:13267626-Alexandrium_andersonii.AAC.1
MCIRDRLTPSWLPPIKPRIDAGLACGYARAPERKYRAAPSVGRRTFRSPGGAGGPTPSAFCTSARLPA